MLKQWLKAVLVRVLKTMSKQWFKAALVRALKTMSQTAAATLYTATVLSEVNWIMLISASILSGLLSMLTSIGGLPEVKEDNL